MSPCVHAYLASNRWSSVYLEELAVKRLSCVYACVVAATVIFFALWGKKKKKKTLHNTVSVLAEQSIRTGGYSGVWPSESVCIHDDGCVTTVFGSIKPYLWHGLVFGLKSELWVCVGVFAIVT